MRRMRTVTAIQSTSIEIAQRGYIFGLGSSLSSSRRSEGFFNLGQQFAQVLQIFAAFFWEVFFVVIDSSRSLSTTLMISRVFVAGIGKAEKDVGTASLRRRPIRRLLRLPTGFWKGGRGGGCHVLLSCNLSGKSPFWHVLVFGFACSKQNPTIESSSGSLDRCLFGIYWNQKKRGGEADNSKLLSANVQKPRGAVDSVDRWILLHSLPRFSFGAKISFSVRRWSGSHISEIRKIRQIRQIKKFRRLLLQRSKTRIGLQPGDIIKKLVDKTVATLPHIRKR